eukprot:m.242730 g.242730  ORF g.242730 m.242730 type:complete len:71 (+) comp26598_c1_seq24:635-847(+)
MRYYPLECLFTPTSVENPECVVCLCEPACVTLLPCRHQCLCETCLPKMHEKCPLCREHFVSCVHEVPPTD